VKQNAVLCLNFAGRELKNMSWQPVYRLIKKIPRGKVTTYGELGRSLRLPGGARAVGYAMAACPSGQGIPWHRVVGAGGRLLIPEPYGSLQRRLLESEGVHLDGSRIDMSLFSWSPAGRKTPGRKRRPKSRARAKSTPGSSRPRNRAR
jgi:methylated-DNA-protein-cysteine methyltransferase related protein